MGFYIKKPDKFSISVRHLLLLQDVITRTIPLELRTMAFKTVVATFLRHQLRQRNNLTSSISYRVNKLAPLVLPQIRLDSTDTNAKVVADCSGNACEPIKVGAVCMPGSEEFCIGGHMPGQEDAMVGDHSTVTPGQYSKINTESEFQKQQKAQKQEVKTE